MSYIELFMEYDRNNFYVPSCGVSLVNPIKPGKRENTAAIVLYYILQNKP
jgi:hypothetical protein